ncbi:hypothetical protein OPQ81_001190 [Rhizoctonia solani]|nr:hypothetical protein OPQ81_001190 [Rhizoctonia solani]
MKTKEANPFRAGLFPDVDWRRSLTGISNSEFLVTSGYVPRTLDQWSAISGISVDEYLKLSETIHQGVFARDGKLNAWVLAPEDDPETIGFFASCMTLTREVLTLEPGQNSPKSSFGHTIIFVLVPPEHRGKGYAKHLMSLMHSVLAPHRYPNPRKAYPITNHHSTVSTLYTTAGDYYSRCVPSEGESGWSLQKSFITNWSLSNAQLPLVQETSTPVELLSESDATTTLDLDDSNIPDDLLKFQREDPKKTYFAFVPTSPLNAHSITLCKSFPGGPSDPSWGAKIRGGRDFMTWIIYSRPKLQLVVTRVRATVHSFPLLLHAALRAAQGAKCEGMEVLNLPEHLIGIAQESGGETTERATYVSMFKWYGQRTNSTTVNANVVWALNEHYCS